VKGGSVAARLLRMGRTNGIELSPDEKTLYISEAFNREFIPVSNVVWQFDVDILTGNSVRVYTTIATTAVADMLVSVTDA
jgi:sugar lactone lactonase YvrE